jgi:hypothetical protein
MAIMVWINLDVAGILKIQMIFFSFQTLKKKKNKIIITDFLTTNKIGIVSVSKCLQRNGPKKLPDSATSWPLMVAFVPKISAVSERLSYRYNWFCDPFLGVSSLCD